MQRCLRPLWPYLLCCWLLWFVCSFTTKEIYAANSTCLFLKMEPLGTPPTACFSCQKLVRGTCDTLQDCLWSQSWFLPSNHVMVLLNHLLNAAVSDLNCTPDISCRPQSNAIICYKSNLLYYPHSNICCHSYCCCLTCMLPSLLTLQ